VEHERVAAGAKFEMSVLCLIRDFMA